MTRRDYHLASRPALVRATSAEIGRARDQSNAFRTSSGSAARYAITGSVIVRTEKPLRSQGRTRASVATAVCLELIHHQQVIVAGQRGVIMRGRRRHSDTWPPTTREPISRSFDEDVESDAQTEEALRVIARLLARQAAREVFERESAKGRSNHSSEEGQE
jgi:hypothetical protein